jgi:polyferredoxin
MRRSLSLLIPVVISILVLGAHFLRADNWGMAIGCVAAIALLFSRRRWVAVIFQVLLLAGVLVWVQTAVDLVRVRQLLGAPYLRLVLILGVVAAVCGASSLLFLTRRLRQRYSVAKDSAAASASAFVITAVLVGVVQQVVDIRMLLLDRFLPGGGWLTALALAAYAAWLVEKMLDPAAQPEWRRRAWSLFSVVFFAQLALGLLGLDRFLLTGELHLPVPALIMAGPIYRGAGLFMPILFLSTLLLVGPAWCSHLCYIGAWDNALAAQRRRPTELKRWASAARIAILIVVAAAALALRLLGLPGAVALGAGLGFGIVGVGVMLVLSQRTGAMVHCTVWCPIGLLADVLGKISPFRIRIGDQCNECGKCRRACRFDALNKDDIARRKPALTCALCGDCITRCEDSQIGYRFPGLSQKAARTVFITVVVALHAVFLGVARI